MAVMLVLQLGHDGDAALEVQVVPPEDADLDGVAQGLESKQELTSSDRIETSPSAKCSGAD